MAENANDLSQREYHARLTDAVRQALEQGARTVTDLCRNSGGAFPTDVVAVARELLGSDLDHWPHRRWPDDALGTEDAAVPSMPEPHPIDFEWRYTAATADALAKVLASRKERIGCFGTPSVFVRLVHQSVDAVLVDRNPGLVRHFAPALHSRMLTADLSQEQVRPPMQREDFDTILLDPPWYVSHTLAWVGRALSSLRSGGRIIVTLFPELLRPDARREREDLLTTLQSLGEVRRLDLLPRYTTPVFESETLSAFGLADLGQWRTGELFEVTVRDPATQQLDVPTIENPTWDRVQLGRQVVAIRNDPATRDLPISVQPVGPTGSFLLRSVSARDPVRQNVTVWTSRNRGASVTGTGRAHQFLARVAGGESPKEVLGTSPFTESRGELISLLALVGW